MSRVDPPSTGAGFEMGLTPANRNHLHKWYISDIQRDIQTAVGGPHSSIRPGRPLGVALCAEMGKLQLEKHLASQTDAICGV